MSLDRFLNLLAAVFGAMGSIYVLNGLLRLTPDLMARLATPRWGFNPEHVDSLATQKADSIVGAVLVVIAFLLAAINLVFVPDGIRTFDTLWVALALVAAIAVASYAALVAAGSAIYRKQKRAVGRIMAAHNLEQDILPAKRLTLSGAKTLRYWARELLEMSVDDSEPPRLLLNRFAEAVGKQVPADFDFSEVEKK
jgi:hypothetical protein